MKRKTYVIKNIVTGKYIADPYYCIQTTKDIAKARTYNHSWVQEIVRDIKNGIDMLGRNERFVEISIKEVK